VCRALQCGASPLSVDRINLNSDADQFKIDDGQLIGEVAESGELRKVLNGGASFFTLSHQPRAGIAFLLGFLSCGLYWFDTEGVKKTKKCQC
jgi:hypothetical protein